MAETQATAEITCLQCAGTFTVIRKRNWHNRKFCTPDCARDAKRAYRPDYLRGFAKRKIVYADAGTKTCRVCGLKKAVTCFHKSTNYADGRQGRCSDCTKAYALKIKGRETPDDRAKRLERQRPLKQAWKKANKDKVRAYTARTTAQNSARHAKWREANPERFKVHLFASNHKRRALKKGGMTGRETKEWFDAQKKVCHWCGIDCSSLPTIDHVKPLSKGGEHVASNLVIACKSCNSRKHAKDPIEFAQSLGRLL